jgi:hypothetical protein
MLLHLSSARHAGGGGGKGKGKESKCKGGKGADAKGDEEEATRQQVLEREVLKAADLFRWRRCWSTAWRHSALLEHWRHSGEG